VTGKSGANDVRLSESNLQPQSSLHFTLQLTSPLLVATPTANRSIRTDTTTIGLSRIGDSDRIDSKERSISLATRSLLRDAADDTTPVKDRNQRESNNDAVVSRWLSATLSKDAPNDMTTSDDPIRRESYSGAVVSRWLSATLSVVRLMVRPQRTIETSESVTMMLWYLLGD